MSPEVPGAAAKDDGPSRVRALFRDLCASLTRAADAPLDVSHTEDAIRLAQALRAELLAGERAP
jgi:hypothetical protein